MPGILDYPFVVEAMTQLGFVSLYPNSGAFGFPPEQGAASVGWVGPDDPSIRPESRPLTRRVPAPYEATLASLCTCVWTERLTGGVVWVMPKSHWAYELMFGSAGWMPQLLREAGVSPDDLAGRHDGSALFFSPGEEPAFERLLTGLLSNLLGSDFLLAWPGRPVVCTVHHHKQLWWTTTSADLQRTLDVLVPPDALDGR
jgi:hypothetical protein